MEQLIFRNGDLTLHAVGDGPQEGPVVLLLHGFPEFWYGWRKQIGPLAAAGFRVVALDQRGYNESSKPRRVRDYALPRLVSDVVAIIEQLGRERVFLAGHDWGAIVAWAVAAHHPEKVERLAILNVPHPSLMPRFLLTRPTQLMRSWYAFFFQFPKLPEMLFSAREYRMGIKALIRSSRPGTFTEEDLARYRRAWARPGAVRSMIHWYRALFRRPSSFRVPRVRVPSLILWGLKDAFLLPSLAEQSLSRCDHARLIPFEQATHWVQHEEPEIVNRELIDFFSRDVSPDTPNR